MILVGQSLYPAPADSGSSSYLVGGFELHGGESRWHTYPLTFLPVSGKFVSFEWG